MHDQGGDAVPRMAVRVTTADWDGRSPFGIITGTTSEGREIRAAIGSRTLPLIVDGLASGEVVEIVVESWQVIEG